MSQKNTDHTVRRIVLPSGRSIEVVRFHDAPSAPRPLHICPSCASPLVQPLAWQECQDEQWELELECPNCLWHDTGRHSRGQVEQLEDRLDEGLATLLADLQRLTQTNMSDEVEVFSRALAADVILPEDF
ncbi:MAG TPA: hypothetical protein VG223_10755 [Solirubrobacteraceae bacterium]|jgi:hypothetical protein|nr:hypothetical protein [Solirubrobacteraceae bacterium]